MYCVAELVKVMAFHDHPCADLVYSLVFCRSHEAFNSIARDQMDFQLAFCLLQVPCCMHAWRQIPARKRSCSERYAVLLHSYLLMLELVL